MVSRFVVIIIVKKFVSVVGFFKGVALADVSEQNGSKAIQEIEEQFGKSKAVFILTDVRSLASFEGFFHTVLLNKYFQAQLI